MIRAAGRALGLTLGFALMLSVVLAALVGGLAWRLGQGPLPIDPLARLMERQVNDGDPGFRLAIGGAALAWEGFGGGVDRPLDVRVTDLRVIDPSGSAALTLPAGEVSLSLRSLLLGRIEPRAIALRGLRLTVLRREDGSVALDLGGPEDPGLATDEADDDWPLLAAFGLVPAEPGVTPRFASLRTLLVTGAKMTVVDRQLGALWSVPDARLSLRRRGAESGTAIAIAAEGVATAGAASLPVSLDVTLFPGGEIAVDGRVEALSPAAIAAALPALGPLAAVEAPVAARLSARRDAAGGLVAATLEASLGPGRLALSDSTPVPVRGGRLDARYDGGTITVDTLTLTLAGTEGPSPTATLSGAAIPDQGGAWIAEARVRLDQVAAKDLPLLWPEGIGANERRWITANITAGTLRDLDVTLRATIARGGEDIVPDRLSGTLRGEDLTVHYLRPMPPVEGVAGTLTFRSLAEIDIAARGGRLGAIAVPEATVRLFDLDRQPNRADIRVRIETPLAEAMALIAHPKLDLFGRRGAPPPGITGRGEVTLSVAFPLLDGLSLDELDVAVAARASEVRIPAVLAGRDFERGRLELAAGREGMRVSGSGQFGTVTAEVTGEMDFRSGPPAQIVERYAARVPAQEGLPALFDLDLAPWLTGPVAVEAAYEARRNGAGSATVRADLAQASLAVAELGVAKPRGRPGAAEARLSLAPGGRLTGAELTRLEAGEIGGRARFLFAREGRLERVEVAEARLGASRLAGSVRLPARPGGEHAVTLRAAVLDFSNRPREPAPPSPPPDPARPKPTVLLDAAIDRLVLSPGRELREVRATGAAVGDLILRGEATARAGERGTLQARIAPDGPRRRSLTLTADDAGAVLNALDIITTMAGGTLAIRGSFDDATPGHPLTGEAELVDFRLREAPAAARVLQAMTLYGVLDVARGPGVSFTRAVAPFTYTAGRLELRDARAISPSLGFTARGTIDRTRDRIDLEGTIVPAYVFNALLGQIPLIGRLFAPETGGGLFAATYRLRGPLSDPEASVNPLAALTPGFLRGLFGIFEGGQGGAQPADAGAPQRGG
jgi:hypothetical protein